MQEYCGLKYNKGEIVKVGVIHRGTMDYFNEVEIFIPEETIKALTDLIDERIDKRLGTITIKLDGNSNELTKCLQTLNNSLKP